MKLFNLILLGTFFVAQLAIAGDFTISQKDCTDLSGKFSILAYSPDYNLDLYVPYDLNKGIGSTYIDRIRHDLNNELTAFCKSGKEISFQSFTDTFHSSCSEKCQINKTMLPKNKRDKSDTICLKICNDSYQRLQDIQQGYNFSKCSAAASSGDNQRPASGTH